MEKVAPNTYAEINIRGCNPGFVVTSEGVVMIDTPQMPTDAVKWRDIIAGHGRVRYLINTEPHGDHYTGNCYFEGTVVAHEGVRQAILASNADQTRERMKQSPADYDLMKDFKYRPPTITLTTGMTLYVGNHTFRLANVPGHTPYQVAVHIPEEGVVFTSDNVFYKVQPWLQQAVPFEWIESLKKIGAMNARVLVPGHGGVCDNSFLPEMTANIQAWIDAVRGAIGKGWSVTEAQENLPMPIHYPTPPGGEAMDAMIKRMNTARLYEALGSK